MKNRKLTSASGYGYFHQECSKRPTDVLSMFAKKYRWMKEGTARLLSRINRTYKAIRMLSIQNVLRVRSNLRIKIKSGTGGSDGKESSWSAEIWVLSLGQEYPLEQGMTIQSRIVAWRIPWTEELGGLQSMGSQRVKHNGHDWASMQTHMRADRALTLCEGLQSAPPLPEQNRHSPQRQHGLRPQACKALIRLNIPWLSSSSGNWLRVAVKIGFSLQCARFK